ncbi:MAG: DUF1684 domain-containing protein [Bacteroidales bacterium]|nr:DUF1684 domain-containing protein [Bacteroidales bacterium]
MRLRSFVFILLIGLSALPVKSQISPDSINSYLENLENYRQGRNIKLMYTESSPLTADQLKSFKGLKYFPGNINFHVEATLEKSENPETIIMKTSTERAPQYLKYGYVHFKIDTLNLKLAVYQSKKLVELKEDENTLFMPFRDETTGDETYGGGRYVDCEIPVSGNMVILDFNKAYNPYCAYNAKYSCVIPPDENRLPIRIEAGEKLLEEH